MLVSITTVDQPLALVAQVQMIWPLSGRGGLVAAFALPEAAHPATHGGTAPQNVKSSLARALMAPSYGSPP